LKFEKLNPLLKQGAVLQRWGFGASKGTRITNYLLIEVRAIIARNNLAIILI